MKFRDLFILIIRISATYALFRYLTYSIPQQISYGTFLYSDITGLPYLLLGAIIVIVGYALIIKKAPWLIDTLSLTKGFQEDRIDFTNITELTLYKVTILILSGWVILYNTPELLTQTYFRLKTDLGTKDVTFNNDETLLYHSIELFLSILIFANAKRIATWFSRH